MLRNPASLSAVVVVVLLATHSVQADLFRTGDAPESPRIATLADALRRGDTTALPDFWRELDGRTPLIEPITSDPKHVRVTFIWRGKQDTKRVFLIGGLPGGDETLDRLEGSDVWYLTERIPVEARFGYMFLVDYPKMVPGGFSRNPFPQADPLNPVRLGAQSIAELAQAPAQPWIKPRSGASQGKLELVTIESNRLKPAPPVWVYTAAGYDRKGTPCALLVALDGEACGANPHEASMPIPTIVENLMAAKKIGHAATYDTDTGWLTRQFAASPRLALRFYLEVGLFEQGAVHNMVLENRRFRDVVEAKGYPVTYSEYLGGHDYCCWRGSFADGLVALVGGR
jgi:enterochelin esterase-like enzyme